MASKYEPGGYSTLHLEEVEEICDLRHLYDMPCGGCLYRNQGDCPKVREQAGAVLSAKDIIPI